jgi:hypothetical protein
VLSHHALLLSLCLAAFIRAMHSSMVWKPMPDDIVSS